MVPHSRTYLLKRFHATVDDARDVTKSTKSYFYVKRINSKHIEFSHTW